MQPAAPSAIQRWGRWVVFGALALIALIVALRPRPPLPELALEASAGWEGADPCIGKQRCLIFYAAPWCHACKQSQGIYREIEERFRDHPQVGVKAVVGMANHAECAAYAKDLPGAVYLDAGGALHAKARIEGVPTWLVLDPRRNIVKQQAGTIPDADLHIERLGLDAESRAKWSVAL